jgi:IclR family KDG regulon transcriptional repressor
VALPIMRRLSQQVGECSVLSVRNGNAGIWIEMVESDHAVRLALRLGKALALHAGASSKVLLGFLPDDEMDRILNEIELTPIAANTITDKARLRQACIKARTCGYMVSFEETDAGVMGVAAPVYDHQGEVVAGIGIIAPIVRAPVERVPEIALYVVQAGQELSRMMGNLC